MPINVYFYSHFVAHICLLCLLLRVLKPSKQILAKTTESCPAMVGYDKCNNSGMFSDGKNNRNYRAWTFHYIAITSGVSFKILFHANVPWGCGMNTRKNRRGTSILLGELIRFQGKQICQNILLFVVVVCCCCCCCFLFLLFFFFFFFFVFAFLL